MKLRVADLGRVTFIKRSRKASFNLFRRKPVCGKKNEKGLYKWRDVTVKAFEYMSGVKEEMKKVKWPRRKEVAKGLFATIVFASIIAVFFLAADAAIVSVKGLLI